MSDIGQKLIPIYDIMSDSAHFSPISDVPLSGSVQYRWSRISDWVPNYGNFQYIHKRSGNTYNPDGAYMQKTVIAMTKFTSKPLLMGQPPRATHFLLRSYHHRSASAKSAAALFFAPHPDPSRRPPGWGWGQEALSSPLADSPIMRMLSKIMKKPRRNSPRTLRAPKLAPSCP